VPVSFDNFQNMKYRNSEDWHELNLYKEERVSGALSAQMSFKDYRSLHELANETLVGVQTSDGIVIRSLSKHFMSRFIGSSTLPPLKSNGVRDKIRTGVHLDGIKDALLHGSVESSRYDKTVRVYSGKNTRVTLNIETGNIVQTNPHHPRRKK